METVAFAELISYLTYLCQMSSGGFTREEIESIKRHVTNSTARIDLRPLFSAMTDHRKIEAIKEYRTLTGASLIDSKREVESIYNLLPDVTEHTLGDILQSAINQRTGND